MSIYEYNEEYAMRVTYEDGENAGYIRGREEGKEQALIHYIEAAIKNLGISLESACAGLDVTVEEYRKGYYTALEVWDARQELDPLENFWREQTVKTWAKQIARAENT